MTIRQHVETMDSNRKGGRRVWLGRFLFGGLIGLVGFEMASLVCWLLIPFFPSILRGNEGSLANTLVNAEYGLFLSTAALAPLFTALLMFSWAPIILIWLGRSCSVFRGKRVRLAFGRSSAKDHVEVSSSGLSLLFDHLFDWTRDRSRRWLLILVASIALSFFVAVYPYLPGLNPAGKPVGVDIRLGYYQDRLQETDKYGDFVSTFSHMFFSSPDRPLSLFLMYLGWRVAGISASQMVQFLPAILSPLLVLVTFFFARKSGLNRWASSVASLFATFSFHTTVGLFGGFLSNWIGLLFLYLSLGFLFWSLQKGSWGLLGFAIVFHVALLFSHAYTWEMSFGILIMFFLIVLIRWLKERKGALEVKMVFALLAADLMVGLARSTVLGLGATSVEVMHVSTEPLSLFFVQSFWSTLNRSLTIEMGISFMNPFLLSLAILGGFGVAFNSQRISRFLLACVGLSVVPFVLGDAVVQTRILYDLPVHIFAFFGLMLVVKLLEKLFDGQEGKRMGTMLIILAVLLDLNYALRCSFNLVQHL